MALTSQVYFSLTTQVGGGMEVRGSKHGGCRSQTYHIPSSSLGGTQSHGHIHLQGRLGNVVHQSAQEEEEIADIDDHE